MNNREKIMYLSRFMRLKRKYERVDQQIKGLKSTDFNQVKTTVHKTLAERIHEKDQLYKEMIKAYHEVDSLVGDDIILGYLFICCYPVENIAKQLHMSKNKVKQQLYERLDKLDVQEVKR